MHKTWIRMGADGTLRQRIQGEKSKHTHRPKEYDRETVDRCLNCPFPKCEKGSCVYFRKSTKPTDKSKP